MTRTRWTLPIAALLLAAALTGCGDDGDGGGDGGDGDGGDKTSGADFAAKSAEEISDEVKKVMGDLEAVTIDGTLTSGDQEFDISVSVGAGGDCTGQFETQGASTEILGVGDTTWIRPDEKFWELSVGPEKAPQVIADAGDKWVTLPDDDTTFKPYCDLEDFLAKLVGNTDATYTKGETKEIDGEETIEIISDRPEDGTTSSGYVLVDGEHYLVQISKTEGSDPGEVSFSGFDEKPDVEAPAEDEQVTVAELEAGGSY